MDAAVVYTVPEPLGSMLAANAHATGTPLEDWIEWACWVRYRWRITWA